MRDVNTRAFFGAAYLAWSLAVLLTAVPALCDNKSKTPAKPSAPAKTSTPGTKAAGGGAVKPTGSGPTTHASTTHSTSTSTRTTTNTSTRTQPVRKTPPKTATLTPKGQTTSQTKDGKIISQRGDGKIATLHDPKRNMDVHHGLNGGRRVEVERADHSRIVAERGGRGHVQRPYMIHGHEYARRSYYDRGRYYHAYCGRYYYRGVYVNPYYPARYYPAAYYGWAYNPWPAPVPYAWGWAGNPWYGFYGPWFTPYPVYAGPAFWLTDYIIAASLADAYQAHLAAETQAAADNPPPLSPEAKQLIADEVKRQIALENTEARAATPNSEPDPASSSIQRSLTDGYPHVFIAGQALDVTDSAGAECALSEGDALQLQGATPPDATAVNLTVLASKGGKECAQAATVAVSLRDLQEMQNHMRETIDRGMDELQKKQGQAGLPAPPSSAKGAAAESPVANGAPPPPPEKEVAAQINQESQEADQAEKDAARDIGGTAEASATH